MTKKVGILTLPLHKNYGGILQAVALYKHLESIGFHPTLIQKMTFKPLWKRLATLALEAIPGQNIKNIRRNYLDRRRHQPFINSQIKIKTKKIHSHSQLTKIIEKENFDSVIVGSDQVWRFDYIDDGHYSTYFLDFLNNEKTRKISYAASFGKDHWQSPKDISNVRRHLSKFNSISVREDTGVNICKNTFNRSDCIQTLDPTLLIDSKFYKSIIPTNSGNSIDNYLLSYILDSNQLKEETTKSIHLALDKKIPRRDLTMDSPATVPEWLQAFENAAFVVTDSFHGMVFSIIFNKSFIVLINDDRGRTRFDSLLRLLNLQGRILEKKSDQTIEEIINKEIDYKSVNLQINHLREASEEFLENSISCKH